MQQNLIQSQISINKAHINALHEAIVTNKELRKHFNDVGRPMFAEHYHQDIVKASKKIVRLVKLQKALKADMAEEISTNRFWNKAFKDIADAQYDLLGV